MPLSKQEWLALEKKAHELRRLCLDTTYWAGSGHIGGGMSVMDMLTVLYHKYMRLDVKDPKWEDRDRFILSGGHGSMLLYSLFHLFGIGNLSLEEVKNFRQFGSLTPGHPEYGHTVGVEATTGPLGQGMAMAVGMAMAEKHLAATFNKENFPVVLVH